MKEVQEAEMVFLEEMAILGLMADLVRQVNVAFKENQASLVNQENKADLVHQEILVNGVSVEPPD